MTVATDMQTDFSASLLEDFGEDVIYTHDGTPRTIKAIVRRLTADVHAITRTLTARVTVLNHATNGISSADMDIGSDTIQLTLRRGDAATVCRHLRILSHSEASITLEVH